MATYPYVYAHTKRDFLGLISEIDALADANPAKKAIGITVCLRSTGRCRGICAIIQTWAIGDISCIHQSRIVIALNSQADEVARQLGGGYRLYSTHELRPGNMLVLFVRMTSIRQPDARVASVKEGKEKRFAAIFVL